GHVTVTNVLLYNERLLKDTLHKLQDSKVTIPSLGAEKQPTELAASKDVSVDSQSNSEESTTSHEELNEDDREKRGKNSVDVVVPAASSSTAAAGLSVPEPAIATEIAGNSRPEDNTQLSEDETSRQATLNEDSGSMQRDSNMQPQYPQSEVLTEATDVETSPESNDAPEEDGGTNDMSGGSTSSVGASSDMDTATRPADGEHQVQQKVELSTENNDVRSTGTGTTGTEESLSLEVGDRSSERTMNSDSSLTPSKSDAEPTSAEDTDDVSRTERAEVSSEEGEEAPQTVDTAPENTNTTPGETKIPSESNATTPSDNDFFNTSEVADLATMALIADSTVHGCVSRVLLLLLLGLWGTAALR
ncbi:complement regulatory protein, putative, partial [Trypanosoma cruzi]